MVYVRHRVSATLIVPLSLVRMQILTAINYYNFYIVFLILVRIRDVYKLILEIILFYYIHFLYLLLYLLYYIYLSYLLYYIFIILYLFIPVYYILLFYYFIMILLIILLCIINILSFNSIHYVANEKCDIRGSFSGIDGTGSLRYVSHRRTNFSANSPANSPRIYYECFRFTGMASIAAAGLEVHEAGRALRVQTEAPHLVSMGSGRLSTAVTLHPLPEG